MAGATRTRQKLDEARFFLRLCEDNRHLHEFNYYLSACVSAARAVTWIMRAEYVRVDGWEAWYKARTPSKAEERLLRQMGDIRTRSQKSAPLDARAALQVNIPPELLTEELRAKMSQWRVASRFKFAVIPLPAEDSPYPGVPVAPEFQMPEGYPKDSFVGTLRALARRHSRRGDRQTAGALHRSSRRLRGGLRGGVPSALGASGPPTWRALAGDCSFWREVTREADLRLHDTQLVATQICSGGGSFAHPVATRRLDHIATESSFLEELQEQVAAVSGA